jgi:hypothetical protein
MLIPLQAIIDLGFPFQLEDMSLYIYVLGPQYLQAK